VPGEVIGLRFETDKETLVWDPEPTAIVYDVLTGDLGNLAADGDFSRSRCLAWRVPGTFLVDESQPYRREGFYYLVRGKTDPCLLGTWGSTLRDQAALACP
jgi:hypothetical protein